MNIFFSKFKYKMFNLNSKYPIILNKKRKHKFFNLTKIIEQLCKKKKGNKY